MGFDGGIRFIFSPTNNFAFEREEEKRREKYGKQALWNAKQAYEFVYTYENGANRLEF